MQYIFTVYAQSIYSPQGVADANSALFNTWLFIGAGFAVFFVLCFLRVRNLILALRYSVWFFVAAAAVFGAVSLNRYANLSYQSQADSTVMPANLQILYTLENDAVVTWHTDKAVVEYVVYLNDERTDIVAFDEQQLILTQNHRVTVSGLQRRKVYPFRIKYVDKEFSVYEGKPLEITLP